MKTGFIALLGRTNVGKSSILNEIIQEKVSIVTYKPQTTRNKIRGIYTDDEAQLVFLDTPGIHHPYKELGKKMNHLAFEALKDADVIVLVVDVKAKNDELDEEIIERLKKVKNLIICFNKIDLANIIEVEEKKNYYKEKLSQAKIIETSVKDHFNLDGLIKLIKEDLSEGPLYYDSDDKSDASLSFKISETIREKALNFLRDEVPHALYVEIENIEFKPKKMIINASLILENEGQKGIVIGKNGRMIQKIGRSARMDLENMFHKTIYLELFVKVKEDWRDKNSFVKTFQ